MDGRWLLLWISVVAAVIASIVGWPGLSTWLKDRQELAAWVQALGSVAAILATGWAVNHAHNLQDRQRRRDVHDDYTKLLEAIYQLVGGAHMVARKIHEYIEGVEGWEVSAESVRAMHAELSAVAAALARVDVTQLDRFELVQSVLIANAVVPRLQAEMESGLRNTFLSGGLDGAPINAVAQETAETLKPFGKLLLEVVKLRGGAARADTFKE
ncbi:hypothetical protein J2W30_006715 [Variovorax boronicumulans]|uniref:hypothetical protein n=1 Tax=Variovorax boronicumulans TaxID=436515 RepID=UPI00277EAF0F|nr:hypothetical protein [Variovorax boronicumulans]MDQ0038927.1 hypothetical protein [Variovorax boronicumulans]